MQLILDERFDSLEQLVDGVRNWDLDFRLMHGGGFAGRVRQLVSPDVLLSYARFKKGLHQAGTTPPGYRTFVVPGAGCQGFWWRGQAIGGDELLVFPSSNELYSASLADFEVFTISLRSAYMERVLYDLGFEHRLDDAREVIRLGAAQARGLRWLAARVATASDTTSARELSLQLAENLLVQAAGATSMPTPCRRKRDLAAERILDYLSGVQTPSARLTDLCRIAGVSERTLQYAFRERYGVAPNTFVKRWKLNSARRLLLDSGSDHITISDLALGLGFSHLGQFSCDYRELFRELPSQTRVKSS